MFDSEKLIIAIESRPCLWNNGDASYSNRQIKKIAWEQIGEEFYEDWSSYSAKKKNETIDDLQKKWKHLRDYYVREKKKDSLKSGSAAPAKKRNTSYFQMLSFLDITMEHRNNDGSLPEDESSTSCDSLPPTTSPPPVTPPSLPSNALTYSERKNKNLTPFQKSILNRMSVNEENDPDKNFLLSLLPDMKKMTDSEKFDFKFEIMSAIKRIKYSKPIPLSSTPSTSTYEYLPRSSTVQYIQYRYNPSSIGSNNNSDNYGYRTRTQDYINDNVDSPAHSHYSSELEDILQTQNIDTQSGSLPNNSPESEP